MKQQVSRRRFLKTGALAALGGWALPNIIPARVLGREGATPPSEKLGWALIGCGSISNSAGQSAELRALCDVSRERRIKKREGWTKWNPAVASVPDYNDFREVLARKDIDIIHVCANDHWHVPIAILAAEAGKHMHIEKPLGLSIGENIALGNALAKHKVRFQFGTEMRDQPTARKFLELATNGYIGAVEESYVIVPGGGGKFKEMPEEPVPDGFDWDMWQGPAPAAPYNHLRWNDYRFQLGDYCHGMFQNWGIHPLNIQQWWADLTGLGMPVHYEGEIKFHPDPCGQVYFADTRLRYRNGQVLHLLACKRAQEIPCLKEFGQFFASVVLKGEKGWLGWAPGTIASSLGNYETLMRTTIESPKIVVPKPRGLNSKPNFNTDLAACIKEGGEGIADWPSTFRSDTIFQLCILLGKVGASFDWDPDKREVVNCEAAKKWLRREMREPWGSAVYKYLPKA